MTPFLPVKPADLPAWHPLAIDSTVVREVNSTYMGRPCKRIRQGTEAFIPPGAEEITSVPTVAEWYPYYRFGALPALDKMARDAHFKWIGNQADYIARLSLVDGALIAAETGTGKTLMAIALIHLRHPRRCLVVAPQGVIRGRRSGYDEAQVYHSSQWEQEFARFAPWLKVKRLDGNARCESGTQVFLTYYQDFFQNGGGGLARHFAPDFFDMVILDEAALIINPETNLAKQVFKLKPAIRYAMTATPVPNRLDEVFPLLAWLQPDWKYARDGFAQLTGREWVQFEGKRKFRVKPTAPACPTWVRRELSGIVAAIRKRDLNPNLPPVHVNVIKVDLMNTERAKYNAVLNHVPRKRMSAGQLVRWRIGQLRGICANAEIKRMMVNARLPGMVAHREQVVVTSPRIEFTERMAENLERLHIRYSRIDSTIPADQHAQQSDAFKKGITDVMLLGLKCASGYSWVHCPRIIIVSPDWGYGSVSQALGRVFRVTSTLPINATVYVVRNSIEDVMINTLSGKESTANAVLYGDPIDDTAEASPDAILRNAAALNNA